MTRLRMAAKACDLWPARDLGGVFAEGLVPDIVRTIFCSPVISCLPAGLSGSGGPAPMLVTPQATCLTLAPDGRPLRLRHHRSWRIVPTCPTAHKLSNHLNKHEQSHRATNIKLAGAVHLPPPRRRSSVVRPQAQAHRRLRRPGRRAESAPRRRGRKPGGLFRPRTDPCRHESEPIPLSSFQCS